MSESSVVGDGDGDVAVCSRRVRPTRRPASFYNAPERVDAAKKLHERTLFAVVRYEVADGELCRGWIGNAFRGENGEGILDNYYVAADDEAALKIVTRYRVCFKCDGAELVDGKPCTGCAGLGWTFDGGAKLKKLGRVLEVRKLEPPSDPGSTVAYAIIEEPD
jgi:hypothetical protein